jgi:hypothetical protein
MTKIERLLVPGSTELPDCRCGKEMMLVSTEAAGSDAHIKHYCCDGCGHEIRLTVWTDVPDDVRPGTGGIAPLAM